mmetsp:Transcript_77819/g.166842  ORF Transcript_77819/g.166842 Transcript_77819/m.166842 type:complete len:395 (+) Transcript_77819:111-1295(+)
MAEVGNSMRYEKGCLPCTNCLVTVPQDKIFASEQFGSFYRMLSPGLGYAGFDMCGVCIQLKSISTRVEQLMSEITTKTQDHVFITAVVATQFQVSSSNPQDAIYKLSNVASQVDSYVADIIRSQIPNLTLDAAFEEKDHISQMVQQALQEHMTAYGWVVHKALVVELRVNPEVMSSMNEMNRQKRLRDATVMAAEADKIKMVKAAEADADAACLQGEGIARQRGAIIEGLRASVAGTGRDLNTEDITQLLLVTQYFETLKDIGSHDNCKAYILPKDDPDDYEAQVRLGMLQGEAALEFLQGSGRGHGGHTRHHRPNQQEMQTPLMNQYQAPPQYYQQPPPPPPPRQPQVQTLQIQVPPGAGPGATIQCQAPDGRTLQVQIPPGVQPGQLLTVQA